MSDSKQKATTLAGLAEPEWVALARRVGNGLATAHDAEKIESIGLLPQAIRVRQGLATHSDGVLVNLQAGLRLLGFISAEKSARRVV